MPFPGVPQGSALEKKIDRCVKNVMARQGKDKSSAIAICRASIKKEISMARKTKSQNRRQRRKSNQQLKQEYQEDPEEMDLLEKELEPEDAEMEEMLAFLEDDEDEEFPEEDLGDTQPRKALKEKNPPSMSLDELTPTGEKDDKMYMNEAVPYVPWGGATSFDELEQVEEQEEKARALRQITYRAEDISSNIVRSPELSVDEKAKALAKLGNDMASRTVAVVKKDFENDLELAEVEAMLNHVGTLERLEAAIKSKISTSSRNDLPDSAFACISPGGTKDESGKTTPRSLRHYPIYDEAHVRNALARVAQELKKGGEAAKVASCAKSKVMAAAKKMGIGQISKELPNGLIVEKDTSGEWRWTGWVSNNFVDREGEIITEQAHKDFVDWLDKNPQYAPEFWVWHTKGTARKSQVDFWDYVHGFLVMSGPLTEDESLRLLQASSKERLGMSHGFLILQRNKQDSREIEKYRTFEVSDLPLSRAANPFTNLETHIKEINSMDTQKMEHLKTLLGEDRFNAILEETQEKQAELQELGVTSKDKEETPTPAPETQPAEKDEAFYAKLVDDIAEKVLEKAKIPQLSKLMEEEILPAVKDVGSLKDTLKELKGDEEEKIAELFTPPIEKQLAWDRPSESKDNLATKEEKEKAQPGISTDDWLSQATGIPALVDAEGGA